MQSLIRIVPYKQFKEREMSLRYSVLEKTESKTKNTALTRVR